jgi:gliding motility-associated-like protein
LSNTTSSISVTAYGVYQVTVNNNGCSTTSLPIEVTLDTTEITINTTGECFGTNYIITATPVSGSFDPSTVNYEWTNSSGTVVGSNQNTFNVTEYVAASGSVSFPATFNVKITTTPEGCTDSQEFVVVSSACTIQKGISPNGDGDNDYFDLKGLGVKHLGIFNRYGTKVFSFDNYRDEWHGQTDDGKDLPVGTYYFVIDQNSGETKTGWIYINK